MADLLSTAAVAGATGNAAKGAQLQCLASQASPYHPLTYRHKFTTILMILALSLSLPSFNRCRVDGTTIDQTTVIGCYSILNRALLLLSVASASAAFRIRRGLLF